jgi:hypothetical protein
VGFRFQKRIGVGPFKLNLSKTGVSVSAGVPGATVNYDLSNRRKKKLRATVGLPGTGLSYREDFGPATPQRPQTVEGIIDHMAVTLDGLWTLDADLMQPSTPDMESFFRQSSGFKTAPMCFARIREANSERQRVQYPVSSQGEMLGRVFDEIADQYKPGLSPLARGLAFLAVIVLLLLIAAHAHAEEATDIWSSDVGQRIAQKCATEWPDDFDMRVYCENKQRAALVELQRRHPK